MSVVKVAALAVLLMLPVLSHAEGGGDRVIEQYKNKQDALIAEQAKDLKVDKQIIAEQSEQRNDSEG